MTHTEIKKIKSMRTPVHTTINCFRNVHTNCYVPKNHHIAEGNYAE